MMKKKLTIPAILIVLILFEFCSTKDNKSLKLDSAKTLYSVTTTDNTVFTEIDTANKKVQIFIPLKSELEINKIPLSINISSNAKMNVVSGTEYDLTEPFKLVITAQDGSVAEYIITASKCEENKVAVIVSDVQEDIIPLFRQSAFFENLNSVLSKASKADVPIYYIMLSELKNTYRWDFPAQLIYQEGVIIDKHHTVDAFEVSSFHKELLKKGVGTTYITGVSSMGCVKGTCNGALRNKFKVYLVSDSHSEPIGYRTEASIDKCNEFFNDNSKATLILAKDIQF